MSITVRHSQNRAFFDHGWLKTYHTFSFASYYDPEFMGFKSLRVINEDRVAPKSGFATHSHKNMEILTYVVEGSLAHKDSLNTASTIREGEFQLMHAGSGITHSEYNPSDDTPVHILQIWILSNRPDVEPGYQQVMPKVEANTLALVASKDGRDKSMMIYQDAEIFIATLEPGKRITKELTNSCWIQIVEGSLHVNSDMLSRGDGAAIEGEKAIDIEAVTQTKLLLFTL